MTLKLFLMRVWYLPKHDEFSGKNHNNSLGNQKYPLRRCAHAQSGSASMSLGIKSLLELNIHRTGSFTNHAQCPMINFDNVLNTIHKTYIGLTSMLQGFQKCIALNPRKQGMEGPCQLAMLILPEFGESAGIGCASQHGPSTPNLVGFHAIYFWNP